MIIVTLGDFDQKYLFEKFLEHVRSSTIEEFMSGKVSEHRVLSLVREGATWYGPEPEAAFSPEKRWLSIVSEDMHDAQVNVALDHENVDALNALLTEKFSDYKRAMRSLQEEEERRRTAARDENDHAFLDKLRQGYSEKAAAHETVKKFSGTTSGGMGW